MVINTLRLLLGEVDTVPAPDLLAVRHPGRGAVHQVHRLADILGLQTGVVLPGSGVGPAGKVGIILQVDLLVDFNFVFNVA